MIDIDKLRSLAEAATALDLDTAVYTQAGAHVECPTCGGNGVCPTCGSDGYVTGTDYCNIDGKAIGVIIYGIGNEMVAMDKFIRAANPAAVLELIKRIESKEETLAVCENIIGTIPELIKEYRDRGVTAAEYVRLPDGGNLVMFDVWTERLRQIERKGWTLEHDEEHSQGELAIAAACYALHGASFARRSAPVREIIAMAQKYLWPWVDEWWKPKSRRHDLIRAAALIVAEIERLDRAEAVQAGK